MSVNKISAISLIFCLALGLTFGAGCKKNVHGTVPVTVKVTYNGKPIHEAVVVFSSAQGNSSSGATNEKGEAKLSAFEKNDGAIPDSYVVTIDKSELKEERDPDNPDRILKSETIYHIPAVYGDRKTSELTAEVVKGKKNVFTFDLDDSRADEEIKNETSID